MKRQLTTLFIASALAAYAGTADTYTLKRTGKAGDKSVSAFSAEMAYGDVKITVSGKSTDTLAEIKDSGEYTVESVQTDLVYKTGEESLKLPGTDKTKSMFAADRTIVSMESRVKVDAETLRLVQVTTIKSPDKAVAIGEKWTSSIKALDKYTFPLAGEYTILAKEKVGQWDTLKIQMHVWETEGTDAADCSGTIWLDAATFQMVKEELKVKNAPISGNPIPVDAVLKSERTS